jgi:hypothetical protein
MTNSHVMYIIFVTMNNNMNPCSLINQHHLQQDTISNLPSYQNSKHFINFKRFFSDIPLKLFDTVSMEYPLLFTSKLLYIPQPTTISQCPYYGNSHRFELQLIPTLIPQLKLVQISSSSSIPLPLPIVFS